MKVEVFAVEDVRFERSPGQHEDVFTGNLVDERHGGPITIGFGRYAPNQSLSETIAVDDVMIVLQGRLTITSGDREMEAEAGQIVYMPNGEQVTIRSHDEGAKTAYVTYPHWKEAQQ
jgi:ethanolamine utilization protein EutQ (cupin superfamily)